MSDPNARYDQLSALEPLLPTARASELAELTAQILLASGKLSARLPAATAAAVATVVRQMNSYYSHLIEGHQTLPRDIEAALRQDFSSTPAERQKQELGLAHTQVEISVETRLAADAALVVESTPFLCGLHEAFYAALPPSLRIAHTVDGRQVPMVPGELRVTEVDVGSHRPPLARAVPALLDRLFDVYRGEPSTSPRRLIAVAAAHHRVLWVHPFRDGNGRVTRLLSQAMLIRSGLGGTGLWTISRGLARRRADYYAHLAAADQERHNDLDGRGNLSDRALADFCVFFLEVALDQIRFMDGLLELNGLEDRLALHLRSLPALTRSHERAFAVMREVYRRGELTRALAIETMGASENTARPIVRHLLDLGLLTSTNQKAPLRPAFPSPVHEALFPRLFLPAA